MPPQLARIILKALAKNPAERFPSASEFLAALDAIRWMRFIRWSRHLGETRHRGGTELASAAPEAASHSNSQPAAEASVHSEADLERVSKDLASLHRADRSHPGAARRARKPHLERSLSDAGAGDQLGRKARAIPRLDMPRARSAVQQPERLLQAHEHPVEGRGQAAISSLPCTGSSAMLISPVLMRSAIADRLRTGRITRKTTAASNGRQRDHNADNQIDDQRAKGGTRYLDWHRHGH